MIFLPLPDSSDPKKANIYTQLSSTQIKDASKSNFNVVKDPQFLDSASEDDLRRINLVGQAANIQSQSGIIVNTGVISDSVVTDSGYTNGIVTLSPPEGEAWKVMGISVITNTAPSSSQTRYLFLQDRNLSNTSSSQAIYLDFASSSSSNQPWSGEVSPSIYGFTLTYPHQLFMYVNDMRGTTTVTFKTAYYVYR